MTSVRADKLERGNIILLVDDDQSETRRHLVLKVQPHPAASEIGTGRRDLRVYLDLFALEGVKPPRLPQWGFATDNDDEYELYTLPMLKQMPDIRARLGAPAKAPKPDKIVPKGMFAVLARLDNMTSMIVRLRNAVYDSSQGAQGITYHYLHNAVEWSMVLRKELSYAHGHLMTHWPDDLKAFERDMLVVMEGGDLPVQERKRDDLPKA